MKNYLAAKEFKVHFYSGVISTNLSCLGPFIELYFRMLGKCLLISSLPGKALRTLNDIGRLAERFNMHSQSRAW